MFFMRVVLLAWFLLFSLASSAINIELDDEWLQEIQSIKTGSIWQKSFLDIKTKLWFCIDYIIDKKDSVFWGGLTGLVIAQTIIMTYNSVCQIENASIVELDFDPNSNVYLLPDQCYSVFSDAILSYLSDEGGHFSIFDLLDYLLSKKIVPLEWQ